MSEEFLHTGSLAALAADPIAAEAGAPVRSGDEWQRLVHTLNAAALIGEREAWSPADIHVRFRAVFPDPDVRGGSA